MKVLILAINLIVILAVMYGDGVYFAVRSAYSAGYAKADASGIKRMFQCKVLTGMFCHGAGGMRVLPDRKDKAADGRILKFDSAVDNLKDPNMYIVFSDRQAYPEYLIEYK